MFRRQLTNRLTIHFTERDAAAFIVTDTLDGNSARGDFAGQMDGIVRPILVWETDVQKIKPRSFLNAALLLNFL